jgi:hypothetical protein
VFTLETVEVLLSFIEVSLLTGSELLVEAVVY